MNDHINELLQEEIKAQIANLRSLDDGSEEKSSATDDITKLCRIIIDEEKIQQGNKESNDKLKEQIMDRKWRLGIAMAETILPLMFYARWMKRGFEFEKDGAYTSTTFRTLFNRFKPTKK